MASLPSPVVLAEEFYFALFYGIVCSEVNTPDNRPHGYNEYTFTNNSSPEVLSTMRIQKKFAYILHPLPGLGSGFLGIICLALLSFIAQRIWKAVFLSLFGVQESILPLFMKSSNSCFNRWAFILRERCSNNLVFELIILLKPYKK